MPRRERRGDMWREEEWHCLGRVEIEGGGRGSFSGGRGLFLPPVFPMICPCSEHLIPGVCVLAFCVVESLNDDDLQLAAVLLIAARWRGNVYRQNKAAF